MPKTIAGYLCTYVAMYLLKIAARIFKIFKLEMYCGR